MSAAEKELSSPTPFAQLDALFTTFPKDPRTESSEKDSRRKTLSDGTSLSIQKNRVKDEQTLKTSENFFVSVITPHGEALSYSVGTDGLQSFFITQVQTGVVMWAQPYFFPEEKKGLRIDQIPLEQKQSFRNECGKFVAWTKAMVQEDRFLNTSDIRYPLSMFIQVGSAPRR